MIKPKEQFHGSDLEKIEKIYGIKKENITSFAANVNPLGISPRLKESLASHLEVITTYPDREYVRLRQAISSYTGAKLEHILVGNGVTELISILIQIKRPKKALLVSPTYSEYGREVRLAGGEILYFPLKEEENFQLNLESLFSELRKGIDLLILCNPNNPTSTAIASGQMRKILAHCRECGCFVLVDETYVEFTEQMEQITAVPLTKEYDNFIVLRGLSKFFAAPGLRLGYAVLGNTDLLLEINEKKNPWSINSLASVAGEIMFSDTEYIDRTRRLISSERSRMYDALLKLPEYKVYPPFANFVLVRIKKEGLCAGQLFTLAIQKGLMLRDCSDFPFLGDSYIRFCFMLPEKNEELLEVLKGAVG
jgi:threonine-phosphate decarboxylase